MVFNVMKTISFKNKNVQTLIEGHHQVELCSMQSSEVQPKYVHCFVQLPKGKDTSCLSGDRVVI